ncbi:MAG TPA: FUSC family protein [Pseudonocardia sp.]|nr:FUSC family protein [Pseudonocardia sp.]
MRSSGRLDGALRVRWRRLRVSSVPILQCALAAGAAWFVATDLVGHARPFFAPIAAVISLGVSLGSRLRRAVELVVGVSLGVLVGDLLIAWIGSGPWQIALVVALAMAAAVFADGGALLVAQAGSSAVLVATLLPPSGAGGLTEGLDRCVDALIGGAIGLLVAAVLPADPVGPVRRAARVLLDELAAVLSDVADALRRRDADAAAAALQRARGSQKLIDSLRAALRGGREVASVSPLRRRRRVALGRYTELAERADYAMRNARVLARRAYGALIDGEPAVEELPDLVAGMASAVHALTGQLGRDGDRTRARAPVLEVVRHAAELSGAGSRGEQTLGPSEQVIVAQLQSIALDLLQATGMGRAEALAAMREPREGEA